MVGAADRWRRRRRARAYPGTTDIAFPGVDMSLEYPGSLDVVNASPANNYRK